MLADMKNYIGARLSLTLPLLPTTRIPLTSFSFLSPCSFPLSTRYIGWSDCCMRFLVFVISMPGSVTRCVPYKATQNRTANGPLLSLYSILTPVSGVLYNSTGPALMPVFCYCFCSPLQPSTRRPYPVVSEALSMTVF